MFSQYEQVAHERMRERRERAARDRLVRELSAGRRWQWLANFFARRAVRSRRRACAREREASAGYELAG